jgi:recombination protein RecT
MPNESTALTLADAVDNKPAKATSPANTIKHTLDRAATEIAVALPEGFPGGEKRFARIVMTAVSRDPNLLKCSARSIIGAAIQAAQLGLTPGLLGEAWILPYGNEASFQVGYKGLISLAARAGIAIEAQIVYEHDEFSYELGITRSLVHKPYAGDGGKAVFWYAIARRMEDMALMNYAVLTRAKVEKRRNASKSKNSPAWSTWYDEMALTKAVREVCKFLPLSVEMATAIASDGAVRTDIAGHADEHLVDWDDDVAEAEVVDG